jgi:hypothetical protein
MADLARFHVHLVPIASRETLPFDMLGASGQ